MRFPVHKKNFMSTVGWFAAALTSATLASCASSGSGSGGESLEVTKGVVIQNATIVNTRDGSLLPRMSIVIDGGKIQKITAIRSIRTSGSALSIDASGKFVVPGFLDMHTHAMAAVDQQPSHWPLMIANGITGIREMGGSEALIKRAQQLNADAAAGRIDAPEVLQIPGDIFVGRIFAPALAAMQVQQQKAMGAGFVKIAGSSREVTQAILAEARNQGLGVAGHLVPGVSAVESSNAGWRAVEHLGSGMGILLDCAGDEASIRQSVLRGEGAKPPFPPTFILTPMLYRALDAPFYQRIMDGYVDSKCQAVAKVFAGNETWQVPTLIRVRTMVFSDDPLYRADPNLMYVDKTSRALWEKLGQEYSTNVSPAAAATFRQYYGAQQKLLKLLKRSGVKMLAGSDIGGIWVIPGFSLHQEFGELAASGLTPLEVLQMTTLNGAEFLHREATMGTVDEGKNADLVLLDANPIESVAHLARISAVVLKGKYFSKGALDKLKSDVADAYKNQPLKNLSAALDPTHVH